MNSFATPTSALRALVLQEWTPWSGNLSLDDAGHLAREAAGVVNVDLDKTGRISLRPQSYVGRLRTSAFDIHIHPKVPIEVLLLLLCEALDLVSFTPAVKMAESSTVEDLVVRAYLDEVEGLLRRGLHRIYVEREDSLTAARGRVEVRATTDLYLRAVPRIACRFEEFTVDSPENRVLLAALNAIRQNSCLLPPRRAAAFGLSRTFRGVRVVPIEVDTITLLGHDVRTRHYRRGLGLAELILRAMGFHERHGRWRSTGFLIDMNKLFETLLTKRLSALLSPLGLDIQRQFQTTLDVDDEIAIKPDIVVRNRAERRVIVDAKYKTDTASSHADLYQMIAYCRALQATDAVLVDVADDSERRMLIRDGVITIHVLHVDLRNLERMAATIGHVAQYTQRLLVGASHPA